jgi:hypothetical protein
MGIVENGLFDNASFRCRALPFFAVLARRPFGAIGVGPGFYGAGERTEFIARQFERGNG